MSNLTFLERRLARLERLMYERSKGNSNYKACKFLIESESSTDDSIEDIEKFSTRTRKIKANLFSRKYDEVKAAIDAGKDCTLANEKMITPIAYACKDPKGQSGDIVELLLEHGANPNDYDRGEPVIFNAIKNKNFDAVKSLVNHGAKVDINNAKRKSIYPLEYALSEWSMSDDALSVIYILADPKICWPQIFFDLLDHVESGDLSKAWYSKLVSKLYDGKHPRWSSFPEGLLYKELSCGVSALYDRHINICDQLPRFGRSIMSLAKSDSYVAEKISDAVKLALSGKIKHYSISNLFDVCNTLNYNIDEMLTPEFIKEACESHEGRRDVTALIKKAINADNVTLLRTIAKSKVDRFGVSEIIDWLGNITNKQTSAAALRIVDNCIMSEEGHFYFDAARTVLGSENDYLVDWAIDKGYGQMLIDAQSRKNKMTKYCANALINAGFDIRDKRPDAEMIDWRHILKLGRYCNDRAYIVRMIKDDEWNNQAEGYLSECPELLHDQEVLNAIKNYPDSITGRQLQRRIDALPKDKGGADKYDL